MKIRYVSDLHLEMKPFELPSLESDSETVLILAGDINPSLYLYSKGYRGTTQTTEELFKSLEGRFKAVLYVAGNHEYYNCSMSQSDNDFKVLCNSFKDFYFLQENCVIIDEVTFIGATLWTNMNKGNPISYYDAGRSLNDFRVIISDYEGATPSVLTPEESHQIHTNHLTYIEEQLSKSKTEKNVVVTHHAPHYESVHVNYRTGSASYINPCFYSDLSGTIEIYKPTIWVHGHTHNAFDYVVNDTRVVCNPRGYQPYEQDTGFNINKLLEI